MMSKELVDLDTQKDIINALSEKIRACYVFPDIAERIIVHLKERLKDGNYSDITDGELFALALTIDMQEVNHDEHLWIRWHPEPLPDFEGQLRMDQEWHNQQRLKASLDSFGLHKLERLPGNIGYLDLRYFYRAAWGGETIHAAMSFTTNMNALIIDLEKCTGGYPDMVALLCSYFFEGPPLHLNSIYWRDEDITQEYWTSSELPGQRFVGKPVYLLVSRMTFSAGESFASILQKRKRAQVIGEKTDGGAHPGASYRIHPHFEAFIPIGRSFDPLTGRDLEGVGVTPDVCVPKEHALQAAYHFAIKNFLAFAGKPPSIPTMEIIEEARTILREQVSKYKFCPACGYQNPLHINKCKNCDEPLLDPMNYESITNGEPFRYFQND